MDYEKFYEGIIGIANGLQMLVETGAEITPRERTFLSVIVENIIFAADEYVPGGFHTNVFVTSEGVTEL